MSAWGTFLGTNSKVADRMARQRSEPTSESEVELLRLLARNLTRHAVFAIDEQGRIETWSETAARLLGYRAKEVLGRPADLLLATDSEDAAPVVSFFAAAVAQARLGTPWEQSCRFAPQGGIAFHARVRVAPLADAEMIPRENAERFTVFVEKESFAAPPSAPAADTEPGARRTIQERRRAAEVEVTHALAYSADAEEAAPRILQAICQNLDWDIGVFWVVDEMIGQLRSLEVWLQPSIDAATFDRASRERTIALGQGWPGRIWETAQPSWITDGAQKTEFPRLAAASKDGLHGAFGIPLMLGSEVLGVAEFYSREIRQPDADLLDMMATLGGHIGQFLSRKRNEQRLREGEQRFRGLMEQAPFSVQIFSPDGHTVRVNRAWEQLWGLKPEQLAQYNILEDQQLAHHNAVEAVRAAFQGQTVEVPPVEYDPNLAVPHGSDLAEPRRWVASVAYPLLGTEGDVREVILVHQDITNQKQAERMLRESEERFRGIVSHSIAGVVEVDLTGRFLFANPRYCEIVGRSWEELQRLTLADVTHPHDLERNLSQFQKIAQDGTSFVIEKRYVRPDGSIVWVNNSVSALRDAQGQVRSVAAVCVDITDRHRAEEALREGEQRMRTLIDSLPRGVVYRTIQNRKTGSAYFTFLSAGVEPIFGVTAEQGMADANLVYGVLHPDDRARVLQTEAEALAEGKPFDAEFRIVHPSGETRWLHCRSAPHQQTEIENEVAWEGVMLDITDRKQAEAIAREHEDRLRLALDAGRMGTWNWNIRTSEIRWSSQLEEIHGLEPGTFPGTLEAFEADIHPEDHQRLFQSVERALATGAEHHIEYRIVLPDGAIRWVEARGRLFNDDSGEPSQMIGVCMEVTERKRKEEDLRFLAMASRSLANLSDHETMLERIAGLAVPHFADWCAIYLPDESGNMRQFAVAHVDPDKIQLARELHRRWPPDPEVPGGVHHVFLTGNPALVVDVPEAMLAAEVDKEYLAAVRQLGLRSYMSVPLAIRDETIGVMTFVSAESGRHYTLEDLALAEDLARRAAIASENARLYAKLQEEARKKDEFLAMLAHELRNPLAPIRCGLDLLDLSGTDPDILATMKQQVEHLVRLVDDLLDVSRIMRGKVDLRQEEVELASVVTRAVDTVRPLIESHRQTLSVDLPKEPAWLRADPVRLAQVIGNLLNNAAKYTEPGGKIWLSARVDEGQAQVVVEDNGIGIHTELLPHVFDLFSQDQRTIDRAQGGLGIGLTVVKSLVELHGGSVSVDSEGPGQGSRFTLRLPTIAPPAPHADGRPAAGAAPPLRILVVDDNLSAAKMLGLLLQKLGGHEILMAHDGLAALEAAKEHRPDLILLDIGLPKLDGFEVGRQLRQCPEFHQIRMVALTGYGTEEDRRKTQQAGFDDHLVKPPGVEMLRQVLETVTPLR